MRVTGPGTGCGTNAADAEVDLTAPLAGVRHLFLLMGQSNMAGRGETLRHDLAPVAGIQVLDGQSSLDSDAPLTPMRWRPAAHPLHRNEPHKNQFGLGMDFAASYAAGVLGVEVGLIPCAWGGQPIERLGPDSALYANTLARARVAARSGPLVGVLWHQGESDSDSVDSVTAHTAALRHLIDDLRHQLDVPDLAFLIGDLAPTFGTDAGPERAGAIAALRAGLARLVAEDVHCGWVSSDGLETAADHTHFTREALRELGRRYAQQMLLILASRSPHPPAATPPDLGS